MIDYQEYMERMERGHEEKTERIAALEAKNAKLRKALVAIATESAALPNPAVLMRIFVIAESTLEGGE